MAHGAAGVGLALREAAVVLDRPDLHAAAGDAIRYERTHYSETHINWPDLRDAGRRGECVAELARVLVSRCAEDRDRPGCGSSS